MLEYLQNLTALKEMADDIFLKYNHDPVCPYCGYRHEGAWEWNFGDDLEGYTDVECRNCEETFHVFREVEVTYSTSKIKGEKPE
jgi:DNA-directed RNA polymerase subunit RPC12/RpoP